MAETPVKQSALAGLALPAEQTGVAIRDAGPRMRLNVRGDASAAAAAGRALGMPWPTTPLSTRSGGGRSALWLGPDEWLVLGPDRAAEASIKVIHAALAGQPASVVDVSHRSVGIHIAGSHVSDVLAAGCPLDLNVFPVDQCARTIFGKAEIILWRTDSDAYHVEIGRSFAPYVIGLMTQAGRDLP